jgi:excinuclease ABC subunit C
MNRAAKAKDFERAAAFRNQLLPLRELNRQILFSDKELMDAARDEALAGLAETLGLYGKSLRRIEGFDISHMQGTDNVASMVVFTNGVPDKSAYRKFKMRLPGNDDFAHMAETIRRRLREENRKKWGIGDLMLIDGGKGQLSAAIKVRDEMGQPQIPMVGLAKQREEIIIDKTRSVANLDISRVIEAATKAGAYIADSEGFISITLPARSPIIKLLQRIRDESHRFAVSYHSTLKRGRVATSLLDDIPGIGPATRKKLLRHFGSMRSLAQADKSELQKVLGPQKGEVLARYLTDYKTQ